MDICTVENPRPVALCKENVASIFDPFQHFTICATTNSLCCQQTRALAFAMLDLLTCLFKPVATQVRESRHALFINTPKLLLVVASNFLPKFAAAQKRRVAYDHVALR